MVGLSLKHVKVRVWPWSS